jgi:hypothetical protein
MGANEIVVVWSERASCAASKEQTHHFGVIAVSAGAWGIERERKCEPVAGDRGRRGRREAEGQKEA